MEARVVLSVLLVCLLVILVLLMCWLHACARWKTERSRQSSLYTRCVLPGANLATQKELKLAGHGSPVVNYVNINKHNENILKQALECPICLCEFQRMELVRSLPRCSHQFHAPCIDVWLLASATCPVCRASCADDQSAGDMDEADDQPLAHVGVPVNNLQYPTNVLFWGDGFGYVNTCRTVSVQNQTCEYFQQPTITLSNNVILQIHRHNQQCSSSPHCSCTEQVLPSDYAV